MRAYLLAALPLLVVTAACKEEPEPQPTQAASASAAGVEAAPGLAASEGKLLLPPIAGRPGAAYFTLVNGGNKAVTLAAASIAGADRTEMHETVQGTMNLLEAVTVEPGETVRFARGGKHLMVFGLVPSVAAGTSAELTLIFADGDKLSIPLAVAAMTATASPEATSDNEGGGTMSGMDMGHGDPN